MDLIKDIATEKPQGKIPEGRASAFHGGALALALLLGLVLRMGVCAWFLPEIKPDVSLDGYREIARNLADGNGFTAMMENGELLPVIGRTPVYPSWLAWLMLLFGDRLSVLFAAQTALSMLNLWLGWRCARHFLSQRGALAVCLLLALDPNTVIRCVDLRTETLFTTLFLSGWLCLLKSPSSAGHMLAAGFFWGLSALCRPIASMLWILPVLHAVLITRAWRQTLLFPVMFCLVISPWILRNYNLTGTAFISTIHCESLFHYRAAGIQAELEGRDPAAVRKERYEQYGDLWTFRDREEFNQRRSLLLSESYKTIINHPLIAVKQSVKGLAMNLLGPGQNALYHSLKEPRAIGGAGYTLYAAGLGMAVLLILPGVWHLRWNSFWPLLLTIYMIGLAAGPESNSRFRVPATTAMAILAVAGAIEVMRRIKSWKTNP